MKVRSASMPLKLFSLHPHQKVLLHLADVIYDVKAEVPSDKYVVIHAGEVLTSLSCPC